MGGDLRAAAKLALGALKPRPGRNLVMTWIKAPGAVGGELAQLVPEASGSALDRTRSAQLSPCLKKESPDR